MIYRGDQTKPLTAAEMDQNFKDSANLKGLIEPTTGTGIDGDTYVFVENTTVDAYQFNVTTEYYSDWGEYIFDESQDLGTTEFANTLTFFEIYNGYLFVQFDDNESMVGSTITFQGNDYVLTMGAFGINGIVIQDIEDPVAIETYNIGIVTPTLIKNKNYIKVNGIWEEFDLRDLVRKETLITESETIKDIIGSRTLLSQSENFSIINYTRISNDFQEYTFEPTITSNAFGVVDTFGDYIAYGFSDTMVAGNLGAGQVSYYNSYDSPTETIIQYETPSSNFGFGHAVKLNNNTLYIGARVYESTTPAISYQYSTDGTFVKDLIPSDYSLDYNFGYYINTGIEQDKIAFTSTRRISNNNIASKVYLYDLNNEDVVLGSEIIITCPNVTDRDFGKVVSFFEDQVLIGPYTVNNVKIMSVYSTDGTKLFDIEYPAQNFNFGYAGVIVKDYIVISDAKHDISGGTTNGGRILFFDRLGNLKFFEESDHKGYGYQLQRLGDQLVIGQDGYGGFGSGGGGGGLQ